MVASTTFNWIYLGTSTTFIDPTEGNSSMENPDAFRFQTFGSTSDPLYGRIVTATTIDNGGAAGALDTNNSVSNDQIATVLNGTPVTLTYDGLVVYNTTVTYADGTTGTVTAVLVQTTTGELFLAPELEGNADTSAFEAKPIVSITFREPDSWTNTNLGPSRWVTGWDNGWVDGTGGSDLINGSYVEPIANGSDRIDNNDGINPSSPNDDRIRAGDGNDTVFAGSGNDLVYGGDGADSLFGGFGADSLYGEAGSDTLYGDAGADLLYGGDSADQLYGGTGNDTLFGEDGNDSLFGGGNADSLFGGAGADTIFGGTGTDSLYGGDGNDVFIIQDGDVTDTVNAEIIDGGGTLGAPITEDFDRLDLSAYGWQRLVIVPSGPESGTVLIYSDATETVLIGTIQYSEIEELIPCFTPGTMILTDRGEVAVECLRPGDMVMTRDNGLQPLRWVGRRQVSLVALMAEPDLQPVRIGRGALDGVGPERDMLVSPQHRVLIEGARAELLFGEAEVLVPAKHLVGKADIGRVLPTEGVTYVHILFDRHEIVQSDGIWTESFQPAERMLSAMDQAARDEVLRLFPVLADQPVAFDGARLSLKSHEAKVLLAG